MNTRRRMRVFLHATTIGCATAFAGVTTAQVTYFQQERSIVAFSQGVVSSATAPDFAPWSDMVEVFSPNNPPNPPSRAFASQTSRLDPLGIFASGICEGTDNGSSGGGGAARGISTVNIRFQLDPAPASAVVRLRLLRLGVNDAENLVTLKLTSGATILIDERFSSSVLFTFPLLLGFEGDYDLSFMVSGGKGGASTGYSGFDYSLELIVPAPASLPLVALGFMVATRRKR